MNPTLSPTPQPVNDPQVLDLSRHALVEASAGTGKTYTIENLVVRLLKEEPGLPLENILLVTFTEKATGELKERIRRQIEQALDHDGTLEPAQRRKLRHTLDDFDRAAITTIHGFCHTLLNAFPFETGNLFQQELIDDGPLMQNLLREQMRLQWPARYAQRLETLLALGRFSENPDRFIQRVIDLARRPWDDPAREIIIPDPAQMDVDRLWQKTRQSLLRLKALVGPPPRFSRAYGRLNINSRSREAIIREMVAPVEQLLAEVDVEFDRLAEWVPLIQTLGARHRSGQSNLERLVPLKWLKSGRNLEACAHLVGIQEELQRLVRLFGDFSHLLTLTSMAQLRRDTRVAKARRGWISYPDMLSRVADFLAGAGAEAGIRHIRNRYRVAFVDEFQDTDALQWRIFSTLFLNDRQGAEANRLFLIGDPKQAIYGFRGADIFTYLGARRRMAAMAGQGRANRYDLTRNWRSLPELVTAFNRIFSQPAWFGKPEGKTPFEIGYPLAESPPWDQLPVRISRDDSRRPAFNVMDLRAAKTHAAAKHLLAGFICREIVHLVGQGRVQVKPKQGCDRPLHYSDMAILVRSRSEFAHLEPQLKAHSIPYAFYRQPGLFQCREAHWLSLVLGAVCHPQRSTIARLALLTPFFDMPPAALAALNEPPADHPSRRLLAAWNLLGQNGRWGRLFQSLLEDSGLMLRHCADANWQRSLTNFQQLFDYLEAAADTNNLDMAGILALLENLRRSEPTGEPDADIHQIAETGETVCILTMHVSKGLEFPVVFIAGGLTVPSDSGLRVYHLPQPADPEAGCRKVIDLTGAGGSEQFEREREDENKRLYYVALTRARIKLYVPYYPDARSFGWLGPVCRFVSQSIHQAYPDHERSALTGGGWHTVSTAVSHVSGAPYRPQPSPGPPIGLPPGRLLPALTDFRHLKVNLESFSSISRRMAQADHVTGRPERFFPSEPGRWEADEPAVAPTSDVGDEREIDPLPGGTEMGSMFHHIFENIDFQTVVDGPEDILTIDAPRAVIDAALRRHRIDGQWRPQIARIVAAALRTPIYADGHHLVLGRLAPQQRRHEVEFFLPLVPAGSGRSVRSGGPDGGALAGEMLMRGFIDLLFEWRGRYYIADWKSNRLDAGYHQEAMAREVASAGYDRQYQLYSIAALRWLKTRLGGRFEPQRHFGGALYLFIRGMGAGGQAGVYHLPAESLLPLDTLEQALLQQVGALAW